MSENPELTRVLLEQWHGGDRAALDELIARDLVWIQSHVRGRVGALLGAKAEVDDYVQDVMIKLLQYGPKFVMSDKAQFRALMARMIENTLRNHVSALKAGKRDVGKEKPVGTDSILYLDPPQAGVTTPSVAVERDQSRDWIRLAIDLLPPDDSRIVRMRDWEQASFAEIGEELGLAEDTARMRYRRLLPKLARQVERLQRGDVQQALDESLRM